MRTTAGITTHRRHHKARLSAKGMQHGRRRSYRMAKQALTRALEYSYRDRRNRKRDFRQLWIRRINNALTPYDLPYSRFIAGLKTQHIEVDRKILSELAIHEPKAFEALVNAAKKANT